MSSIETASVASRARATGSPEIRRLLREPSAVIGATIILFFVVLAVFACVDRALRSKCAGLVGDSRGPQCCTLVRHRRSRP